MSPTRFTFVAIWIWLGLLVATSEARAQSTEKFNLKQNARGVVLIKTFTPGFGTGVGTGFLFGDGLILTCRHVVASPDAHLKGTVVVVGVPSPTNPDELAYFKAEIVPTAEKPSEMDFAVLKIAPRKGAFEFKPLALSFDRLELGSDVAVLGYPVVSDENPGLSFNKGSVSGVRVKVGDFAHYQTDAAVNAGNSGGPMLNDRGEVVGIVTLKKRGADNIGLALQLGEVKSALEYAKAKAEAIRPSPGPVDPKTLPMPKRIAATKKAWDVAHGTATEEKKLLSVDNDGGEYTLVSKDPLPENFQLTVRCLVEFHRGRQVLQPSQRSILRTFGVAFGGSDPTKPFLSQGGTAIQWSAEQLLLLRDGEVVENKRTGNPDEPVALTVTKQGNQLTVTANGELLLKRTVENLKGKTKFAIGGYLSRLVLLDVTVVELEGTALGSPDEAKRGGETAKKEPEKKEGDTPKEGETKDATTVKLPGSADTVCVGGGGRYLILHLPKERQLAVFDFNVAKVVKYLPVPEGEIRFAAGKDHLLVLNLQSSEILRYDLTQFEKKPNSSLDVTGKVMHFLMGSASAGPLVVLTEDAIHFFDPDTMKKVDIEVEKLLGWGGVFFLPRRKPEMRISANGQLLTTWNPGLSPTPAAFHRLDGKKLKSRPADGSGRSREIYMPSPEGDRVLYNGYIMNTEGAILKRSEGPEGSRWMIPALHGTFCFGLDHKAKPPDPLDVQIRTGDGEKKVASLTSVPGTADMVESGAGFAKQAWDQHLFFAPEFKLLAVLPVAKDKLHLLKVDIASELDRSGSDVFAVTSKPPGEFEPGKPFAYAVTARTKKGPVKFKVDAGPKGMTVSPEGKVEWNVPADHAEKEEVVILLLTDAGGEEVFHTFKLVRGKK